MEERHDLSRPARAGLTVNRRTLLGTAGAAALGAAAPGFAAAKGRAPALPATAVDSSRLPLVGGDEFPIGIWWPPPPFQTTSERYQELADAGFTFIITGNYLFADVHIQRHALRLADEVGLKVLADDDTMRWITHEFEVSDDGGDFTLTSAEATAKIRTVLNQYQPSSFWHLQDGHLLHDGGTGAGSIGLSRTGADWADYAFAFDVAPRQTGGGGTFAQSGWAFRATDERNAYVWMLSNFEYTDDGAPGYLAKALFVDGSPVWVRPVPLDFPVTADTWYHVETTLSGDTITTSIDGQVVDVTTDSTHQHGKVGFREAGTTSSLYDNVVVTAPDGANLLADDFSAGLELWDPPRAGGYASFAGLDHYDEPAPAKFQTLARTVQINRELSPETLPYINLFPTTDPNYVRQFVDIVKPAVISFDRYPLLIDGDDPNFFLNWKIIRTEGLRADLPTWCFIQTLAYSGHREPTAAELLWQVNISLAYGAKGIQYFTYWTPDPARGEGFGPALITTDGQRTERYDASKDINTTWLSRVGKQLKPLVSEWVTHANDSPLPAGASEFTPDEYVRSVDGGPVVLGLFRTREASNQRWLLVANRAHSQSTSVRLRTNQPAVTEVARFDPATETYVAEAGARVSVDLEPGAAVLLRLGRRD